VFGQGDCETMLTAENLGRLFGVSVEVGRGPDSRYRMWASE
jgi:hypothetical protein